MCYRITKVVILLLNSKQPLIKMGLTIQDLTKVLKPVVNALNKLVDCRNDDPTSSGSVALSTAAEAWTSPVNLATITYHVTSGTAVFTDSNGDSTSLVAGDILSFSGYPLLPTTIVPGNASRVLVTFTA